MRTRILVLAVAALAVAAAVLAGVTTTARAGSSTTLTVVGPWKGADAESFEAVLAGFTKANPDVNVAYQATSADIADGLEAGTMSTADLAVLSLPSDLATLRSLSASGTVKSLDFALPAMKKNYAYSWQAAGSVDGKLVALPFAASNGSAIWFDRSAFARAGLTQAPKSWTELERAIRTLEAAGIAPFALGSGPVSLPNLFENVYLMLEGGHRYDLLAEGKISWTGPSVQHALELTARLANTASGGARSLDNDYAASVQKVFGTPGEAAMLPGGSAALPVLDTAKAVRPLSQFGVFAFPRISGGVTRVIGSTDAVAITRTSDAARALVDYLASPQAASIWAGRGGFFLSPNRGVKSTSYATPAIRTLATSLSSANVFRYGIAATMPAASAATLNEMLAAYVKNPASATALLKQLNAESAPASSTSP
jgi:alpha-glucoside transport system substrate-binding protein